MNLLETISCRKTKMESEIVRFLNYCKGTHIVYLFQLNKQNICKLDRIIGCSYNPYSECNRIVSENNSRRSKICIMGVPDGRELNIDWDNLTTKLNDNFHCTKIII